MAGSYDVRARATLARCRNPVTPPCNGVAASEPDRYGVWRWSSCPHRSPVPDSPIDALWTQAPVIFRRRQPPPQLIVSANTIRRVSSHMPAPQGPSLPMSEVAQRTGRQPQADVVAAVRDSGTVISFLAGGGSRAHLTTRVYDVVTSPEGCGLGRASSLDAFAEQFCDSADGRRRLVQALAVHRPASDPTALLTRMAITAWVRTVGLAAQGLEVMEAAATGLPDWHTPGDM